TRSSSPATSPTGSVCRSTTSSETGAAPRLIPGRCRYRRRRGRGIPLQVGRGEAAELLEQAVGAAGGVGGGGVVGQVQGRAAELVQAVYVRPVLRQQLDRRPVA